jgi:hypothetical protein
MFFQKAFLDTLAYDFMLIFYKMVDLGSASKSIGRLNGARIDQVALKTFI